MGFLFTQVIFFADLAPHTSLSDSHVSLSGETDEHELLLLDWCFWIFYLFLFQTSDFYVFIVFLGFIPLFGFMVIYWINGDLR